MLIRIFVFTFGLSLFAFGQAKEDPYRYMRILPLGNMFAPPMKLKDGFLDHQPPKPGEAPPGIVVAKGEVPQKQPLRMMVDRLSRFSAIGPEVQEIELSDLKTPGKVWTKFKAPSVKRSLTVLYRDHKKLDWREMKSLVLKDGAKSFPLGAARFVNVSDRVVELEFTFRKKGKGEDSQIGQIKPGQVYVRPLSAGGERVKITIPIQGEDQFLTEKMLKPGKEERIQFFFYKDSVKRPPNPVRVVTFPEKIPVLPKLAELAAQGE